MSIFQPPVPIVLTTKLHPTHYDSGAGFEVDDGASLLMAFRGLQAETAEHGQLHEAVSNELHTLVAEPFQAWTKEYEVCPRISLTQSCDRFWPLDETCASERTGIARLGRRFRRESHSRTQSSPDTLVVQLNPQQVEHLRQDYFEKSRLADEAEDEYAAPSVPLPPTQRILPSARFVSNEVASKYTSPSSSPRDAAHNIRKTPARQPTLSERVTQRLRGLGRTAASAIADNNPPAPPLQVFDAEDEKSPNPEPRLDKGKGKATEADLNISPPPFSLPPKLTVTTSEPESEKDAEAESQKVILAGLPFTHPQISAFLSRAKAEMQLRPVKFPILGEYQDCFTGEEFVDWLLENVSEFQKDFDIVLVAARELTEREDLLRKLGEFGNKFDNADDAFYQFRPKVLYVLSQPWIWAEIVSIRLLRLVNHCQPRPEQSHLELPHPCSVSLRKSRRPLALS